MMADFKFVPSDQGFIDLRNSDFVQQACLQQAQKMASAMTAAVGVTATADVQPGKRRCHARASIPTTALAAKEPWHGILHAQQDIGSVVRAFGGSVGGKK